MKAIFKLPQPQPPKPSPADLLLLTQVVKQAHKDGAPHWRYSQRNGLLDAAIDFLKEGQWDKAEDTTEKAIALEDKWQFANNHAALFSEALIKLKDKATHKSNGEALKVSLKAELTPKKESTHAPVLRQELQEANPPSPAHVPAPLEKGITSDTARGAQRLESAMPDRNGGDLGRAPVSVPEGERRGRASGGVEPTTEEYCVVPGCTDKQSVYGDAPLCPEHRRQGFTPEMCDELDPPCSDCKTIYEDRSACPLCKKVFCQRCAEKPYAFCCDNGKPIEEKKAATSSQRTEATPEHPLVLAYDKRYRLQRYWTAILNRDPSEIRLAVKDCKDVGLDEVYKETVWQLANRDLHQAHKRAREIAVEAWEGEK